MTAMDYVIREFPEPRIDESRRVLKRTKCFLWGASWWVGLALSPENYAAVMAAKER